MKKLLSVSTKEEALYYNKKVYNGEFGKNYDFLHSFILDSYVQKVFADNLNIMVYDLRKDKKDGLNFIDVGTGTGSLSINYYKNLLPGDVVYNLDISEVMLDNLKKKLSANQINQSKFIVNDATKFFEESNDGFDVIGFSGVLHHLFDYLDVIDASCQKLNKDGFIYIASEPLNKKSYIESTIRNFESILYRFGKKEFSFIRLVIKLLYLPFHFLNPIFKIKSIQYSPVGFDSEEQIKSEVVVSGLDLDKILNILQKNKISIVKIKGGPDYIYKWTYKIQNFLRTNSHFQLIGKKES